MLASSSLVTNPSSGRTVWGNLQSRATTPGKEVSLQNAAEEMGEFLHARVSAFHRLEKRDLEGYPNDLQLRVDEVERLLALLDGAEGAYRERPSTRVWLELLNDPQQFQQQLDLLGGPTERYLALSQAYTRGQEEDPGNPAMEQLRDRMDALWSKDGAYIRADVNTLGTFPPDSRAQDRAAYVDAVMDAGTIGHTVQALMARYGGDIEVAIGRLRRALSADLAAGQPSLPHERLEAVLFELSLAAALLPFLANCRALVRRTDARNIDTDTDTRDPARQSDDSVQLLGDLADCVSRWLAEADVRALLHSYGMKPQRAQPTTAPVDGRPGALNPADRPIVFLHGIRAIFRQLPAKVFPSERHATHASEVVGGLIDQMAFEEIA
jgi:type III secretion system YopN/LcrE/InvE/MxiC family regulator